MPPQATPQQALAPQPPATATPVLAGQPGSASGTPEQIYRGLREKRSELGDQKSQLEAERREIQQQIRSGPVGDADKTGLEQRLAQVDQAIAKVSIDIADANAQVAQAASVPGAIVPDPPRNDWEYGPPSDLIAMGIVAVAMLLFPLVIARARRLWRSANVVSAVPPEISDKIARMERGIDAIALEVERIGEGQRFVTQLLAERADAAKIALPRSERT